MVPRFGRSPVEGPSVLLVGPHDPHCGEYTFLAPPLGVWCLQGVLEEAGYTARVFDPNLCDGPADEALTRVLGERDWSVVGFSTTGMTLRFDLALAHLARRRRPGALLVAGGMEATFRPELMFRLAPFDLVVLGEGVRPLLEIAGRLRDGGQLEGIRGTAIPTRERDAIRLPQPALEHEAFRDSIFATPYERMPYPAYWERLERAYRVGELPVKARREAHLAEIRSVRINTLNYCPMGCTFCSSTNFLHAAQGGSIARVARLDAEECLAMVHRAVAAQPGVRTVIFQDDIFVFTSDERILPLCDGIVAAKERGELPADLAFISTNRIDAMTPERLAAMRRAGFRVLGFGVESFSPAMLHEFGKGRIEPYVEPMLAAALEAGITPFLDLILTSPRCRLGDLADTLRSAYRWLLAGCEMGMYPYVIPFSGAAMARDPSLEPHTVAVRHRVAGTAVEWEQPSKILPIDREVRSAILAIEEEFELWLGRLENQVAHLPSRVRSLIWVLCAVPVLAAAGEPMPEREEVLEQLLVRLPGLDDGARREIGRWARRGFLEVVAVAP